MGQLDRREVTIFISQDVLHYTFNVSNGADVVYLNLNKIRRLTLNLQTLVLENGQLDPYIPPEKENYAMYQDPENGAGILVKCLNSVSDCCLYGNFHNKNATYSIQQSQDANSPTAIHEIVKVEVPYNFKGDTADPPDFGRTTKSTTTPLYIPTLPGPHFGLSKREAVTRHIVELIFIVDSTIYDFFMTDASNDEAAALENIRLYFILTMNNMDLRYQSIEETDPSFSINLMLNSLVIAKTESETPWITSSTVNIPSVGILTDAETAINALATFRSTNLENYPSHDHMMSFTRNNLASNSDSGTVGIAFVSTICTNEIAACSLVEVPISGFLPYVAAHELGHGLGSNHDGLIGCNDDDRYIMSVSTSFPGSTQTDHHHKFSTCSVAAIKTQLDNGECTTQHTYNETLYEEYRALPLFGQYYGTFNRQCELTIGPGSAYCGILPIDPATNCYNGLYCRIPSTTTCRRTFLADGTPCDTDNICYKGSCISQSILAPSTAENEATTSTTSPTMTSTASTTTSTASTTTSTMPAATTTTSTTSTSPTTTTTDSTTSSTTTTTSSTTSTTASSTSTSPITTTTVSATSSTIPSTTTTTTSSTSTSPTTTTTSSTIPSTTTTTTSSTSTSPTTTTTVPTTSSTNQPTTTTIPSTTTTTASTSTSPTTTTTVSATSSTIPTTTTTTPSTTSTTTSSTTSTTSTTTATSPTTTTESTTSLSTPTTMTTTTTTEKTSTAPPTPTESTTSSTSPTSTTATTSTTTSTSPTITTESATSPTITTESATSSTSPTSTTTESTTTSTTPTTTTESATSSNSPTTTTTLESTTLSSQTTSSSSSATTSAEYTTLSTTSLESTIETSTSSTPPTVTTDAEYTTSSTSLIVESTTTSTTMEFSTVKTTTASPTSTTMGPIHSSPEQTSRTVFESTSESQSTTNRPSRTSNLPPQATTPVVPFPPNAFTCGRAFLNPCRRRALRLCKTLGKKYCSKTWTC